MDSEDSQTMMEFEIQAVNRLDRIVLAAERQADTLYDLDATLTELSDRGESNALGIANLLLAQVKAAERQAAALERIADFVEWFGEVANMNEIADGLNVWFTERAKDIVDNTK